MGKAKNLWNINPRIGKIGEMINENTKIEKIFPFGAIVDIIQPPPMAHNNTTGMNESNLNLNLNLNLNNSSYSYHHQTPPHTQQQINNHSFNSMMSSYHTTHPMQTPPPPPLLTPPPPSYIGYNTQRKNLNPNHSHGMITRSAQRKHSSNGGLGVGAMGISGVGMGVGIGVGGGSQNSNQHNNVSNGFMHQHHTLASKEKDDGMLLNHSFDSTGGSIGSIAGDITAHTHTPVVPMQIQTQISKKGGRVKRGGGGVGSVQNEVNLYGNNSGDLIEFGGTENVMHVRKKFKGVIFDQEFLDLVCQVCVLCFFVCVCVCVCVLFLCFEFWICVLGFCCVLG